MIENKCIDGNQSHFKCVRLILMFYLFFYSLYNDGGQAGRHNSNN